MKVHALSHTHTHAVRALAAVFDPLMSVCGCCCPITRNEMREFGEKNTVENKRGHYPKKEPFREIVIQ